MCRLVALPPMFPKKAAFELLNQMLGCNTDGAGSAYVRDGKFIINKWEDSLTTVIKDKLASVGSYAV